MNKNRRGFTIVELLIVIVVISILAAILFATFASSNSRAKNVARIDAANRLIKAVRLYHASAGTGAQLVATVPSNQGVCAGKGHKDLNNDGRGDCAWYGTGPSIANSTSTAFDALLAQGGASFDGTYPEINLGNSYAGPVFVNFPLTIDGVPARLQVRYYLEGDDIDCRIRTIALDNSGANYTAIGNHKNTATDGVVTVCIVDMSKYEK